MDAHALGRFSRTPASTVFLFFFPALSVEVLSGSTSLAHFLTPLGFLTLNLLYGGAAVLVRECVVRWSAGLPSIVVLGFGYGLINEALVSKGVFDAAFGPVAQFGLSDVGRVFGINGAWTMGICAFHSIFSVTAPILLVDAVFPGRERRLGDASFGALIVTFAAVVVVLYRTVNVAHAPPANDLAATLVVIVALCVAAKAMPGGAMPVRAPQGRSAPSFVAGLAFALVFFFALFGVYRVTSSLGAYVGAVVALVGLFVWRLLRTGPLGGRAQVALVAGMTLPMAIATIHREPIVAAAVTVWLCAAWFAAKPHALLTTIRFAKAEADRYPQ